MTKIKSFIKNKLGITELEDKYQELIQDIHRAEAKLRQVTERHSQLEKNCHDISCDNSTILRHVAFLNSEFSVASDISSSEYEPSVVLIMRKGQKDIVRTYEFNNRTVEEIYTILEGFGKDNNRIDKPRNFPGPKFRY